ncbi:hypothetical protein DR864_00350 [Runella rosea]|uniref:Phage major capsid protein n=1 Tax=Runella rosea TaxID=2259595 RepID=A0A344TC57_9BACT|nr:hypothetical protein [Runella rosea]AXE16228.1 hypothetical protein DR864_00075 [Runella rosea]AXE16283.1 hypothetical protein DR864_00350 [Runella rosea]
MALLDATIFQKGTSIATDTFKQDELRKPEMGIVQGFMEGTNRVVRASELVKMRDPKRPVEVAVLKRFDPEIGTVRALDVTPTQSQSAVVGLNWFTRTFSIVSVGAYNASNWFDAAQQLAFDLENNLRAVYGTDSDSLSAYLVAFLEASINQALPATSILGLTINGSTNKVTAAINDFYIKMPAYLREMQLTGPYHDFANVGAYAQELYRKTMGQYQGQNLSMLGAGFDISFDTGIAPSGSDVELHYLAPKGTLGLLNYVEHDARSKSGGVTGEGSYEEGRFMFTWVDPFGMKWGVLFTGKYKDLSGTYGAGFERVYVRQWDFAADFAAVKAYSSTTNRSVVVKASATA